MILMSDSERGLWRLQTGLSEKEKTLLQTQNLSRDLKYCSTRNDHYALSEQDFQELSSRRKDDDLHLKLKAVVPSCTSIINNLFLKINLAFEAGNSRRAIYEALLEGEADNTLLN